MSDEREIPLKWNENGMSEAAIYRQKLSTYLNVITKRFLFVFFKRKAEDGCRVIGGIESLLRQNGAGIGSQAGAAALQSGRPAAIAAAPSQSFSNAELAVGQDS